MNIAPRRSLAASAAALTLLAGSASATVTLINFDNLPGGVLVTNQYPGVTFSSDPGEGLYTAGGTPVSSPNYICTAPIAGPIDCINNVYIDFAGPVSGLSIWAIEANEFGVVGTFYLYNGATLLGTQNLIGLSPTNPGFGYGNQFVDLSAFSNVTRLEIRGPGGTGPIDNSYGGVGVAWDDLSFTTVPVPGVISLMAPAGLAAIRRHRAPRARHG